jgi:hypothetical protein
MPHVYISLQNKYVAVSADAVEDWFSYVVNFLQTIRGNRRKINSNFSIHLTYLSIRGPDEDISNWMQAKEPLEKCSSVKRLLNSYLTDHALWL